MKQWIERLKRVPAISFAMDIFARFGRDNGSLLAAGMAFFLVLSFVPLLLVSLGALGYYLTLTGSHESATVIITHLISTQIAPGAAGDEVQHLMAKANVGGTLQTITAKRGISGLVGVLGFIWSALQIFVTGSLAFNAAWETKENRSWIRQHTIALILLIVATVLVIATLAATTVGTLVSHNIPGGSFLLTIGTEIGATLTSMLLYYLLFKYLPAAKVSNKAALFGAVLAAIAWEAAKKGLAVYFLHPNKSLYGDLANLFVFVLWLYYSMMILLLGAEASAVYAIRFEGAGAAAKKRAALAKPSSDALPGRLSPLAQSKLRERSQKLRRAGQQRAEQPQDTQPR